MKRMAAEGFTLHGSVSGPLAVKEGQLLIFKFRGNVSAVSDDHTTNGGDGKAKAGKTGSSAGGSCDGNSSNNNVKGDSNDSGNRDMTVEGRRLRKDGSSGAFEVVGQAWRSFEKKNDEEGNNFGVLYNSNIKSERVFKVRIVDKYSQKALDCYKGFVQIYTESDKQEWKGTKKTAFAENSLASASSFSAAEEDGTINFERNNSLDAEEGVVEGLSY